MFVLINHIRQNALHLLLLLLLLLLVTWESFFFALFVLFKFNSSVCLNVRIVISRTSNLFKRGTIPCVISSTTPTDCTLWVFMRLDHLFSSRIVDFQWDWDKWVMRNHNLLSSLAKCALAEIALENMSFISWNWSNGPLEVMFESPW